MELIERVIGLILKISTEWHIAIFSSLFTSLISIIGIYLTIRHNRKMIKEEQQIQEEKHQEDKRLQVMPFLKYSVADTDIKTHFDHHLLGASFFPYGFINGGNGQPAEIFFSKMKVVNKLLQIKNIGKDPCLYLKIIKLRVKKDGETRSYTFPLHMTLLEVGNSKDIFIQTGLPVNLPEDSEFEKFEDIPQGYSLYVELGYNDVLGNYYEQVVELWIRSKVFEDKSSDIDDLNMEIGNVGPAVFVAGKNLFESLPEELKVVPLK